VTGEAWETTLKGPYLLGASLGVILLGNFRFVPSNHTWVPTLKGLCRGLSVIQDSCTLHCASWVAFLASSIRESCCWNEGMSVFLVG